MKLRACSFAQKIWSYLALAQTHLSPEHFLNVQRQLCNELILIFSLMAPLVPFMIRFFFGETLGSRRRILLRVSAQMAAGGRLFSKSLFTVRHVQLSLGAGGILFGPLGDDLKCPSVH